MGAVRKYRGGENPPESMSLAEQSEWWPAKSLWHRAEAARYRRISDRLSVITFIFVVIALVALVVGRVMA